MEVRRLRETVGGVEELYAVHSLQVGQKRANGKRGLVRGLLPFV